MLHHFQNCKVLSTFIIFFAKIANFFAVFAIKNFFQPSSGMRCQALKFGLFVVISHSCLGGDGSRFFYFYLSSN